MLIVLGGLAALPTEPYESARLDGASEWQLLRYITLPLIMPFIVVAAVIRTIDALKAFDTIYVISQGGPGTASETINLYLYLQAFAFYNVGNASAVVVVFFAIIAGARAVAAARPRAHALGRIAMPTLAPCRVTAGIAATASRRAPRAAASARRKIGFWFAVAVIVSPAILVFLWMLSLSLKNEIENITYPPVFIPDPPTLRELRPGVLAELDGPVFLEQPRRVGRRDAGRAARRRSGRLRHRAAAGESRRSC